MRKSWLFSFQNNFYSIDANPRPHNPRIWLEPKSGIVNHDFLVNALRTLDTNKVNLARVMILSYFSTKANHSILRLFISNILHKQV